MRMIDSSKKTQSSIRYGMGIFMMVCISFNMYVMFLFHRKGDGYANAASSLIEISTAQKVELDNDTTDMLHASRERYKNRRLDTNRVNPQLAVGRRRQKNINNNQQNTKSKEEGTIKTDYNVNEDRIPWPRPDDWQKMTYFDIRKYFQCKQYAHKLNKPLPTEEIWQYFRKMYIAIVNKNAVFNDPISPTQGYTLGRKGAPPFYAGKSALVLFYHVHAGHGSRGRGLFASRNIRAGELIHDGSKSDISFPSGMAWRDYIFSLPRKEACDMIDWSWTQRGKPNGRYHIFTAINISVLLNGGSDESINISPASSTSSMFYSLREIKKDEELLFDYDIYHTRWDRVGLDDEYLEEEEERRSEQQLA